MPAPIRHGELWSATPWVDGVVPLRVVVDEVELHRVLGGTLARLHELPVDGLLGWPLGARLGRFLQEPPSTCPASLLDDVEAVVTPLLGFASSTSFVHGDWGTANVLIREGASPEVLRVIDFEDSHVGDPAEDFKWQVLAGVASGHYLAMAEGYQRAGGALGAHAEERLTLAGVELCLDVLGWSLPPDDAARFHGRCRQTLEEITAGKRPRWSGA